MPESSADESGAARTLAAKHPAKHPAIQQLVNSLSSLHSEIARQGLENEQKEPKP